MPQCLFSVVRHGDQWGVSADGEVLALARRKREARRLAEDAAQTLRDSGMQARVVAASERRSFKDRD